ncbi:MAG: YHS domain-containing (seleno)protein [Verrucomicrobiales bacterium]|nr:YHS domain-containing (seleno)protein [Verrucomicrobiales bacterium]
MNRLLFFLTFITPIAVLTLITSKGGDINRTFRGVALDSYDIVAYQTSGRAAKGEKDIRTEEDGTFNHFISHRNMELFKENPEAYLPAYGGYCAYGVAEDGDRNRVDFDVWDVIDGRLHLFADQTKKTEFNYRSRDLIQQADANWLQ